MHTDRKFVYKVLGKYLGSGSKRAGLGVQCGDQGAGTEIDLKPDALQAILDESRRTDARAKKVKPQEMIDNQYLDEMDRSGFFDQLWAKK